MALEVRIAHTAHDLLLIPERVSDAWIATNELVEVIRSQLFDELARAVAAAVIGALHPTASTSNKSSIARALTRRAITRSSVTALGVVVGVVITLCRVVPRAGERALATRTVTADPVLHTVADVVEAALAVTGALVGAGGQNGVGEQCRERHYEPPLGHRVLSLTALVLIVRA
ncbi:hypothetical protein ON010_g7632 [Phytophthora cinnamomi]|nr:hypothetical protein ON010_g7632 [Phytophthora cinnamomi]